MKRNVMFAVYYVGCAHGLYPAGCGLPAIGYAARSRCGIIVHHYFVITGILTASWLPSAYCMSRIYIPLCNPPTCISA